MISVYEIFIERFNTVQGSRPWRVELALMNGSSLGWVQNRAPSLQGADNKMFLNYESFYFDFQIFIFVMLSAVSVTLTVTLQFAITVA